MHTQDKRLFCYCVEVFYLLSSVEKSVSNLGTYNKIVMAVPFNVIRLRRQREKAARKIQRRNVRDMSNPFEFPDTEFRRLFRASKDMAMYICEELAQELRPGNNDGLPVHIKVLTCLRFMAEGNYQRGTGQDHGVCIAQTTVSKYLSQFTAAVVRVLLPQWINFPGTEPLRRAVAEGFFNKFGVNDVLGAIDCTQIRIFPPKKPQGAQYKNYKGFYSLNCQLIVDVDCKILNVVARYPGRVHDQFIFNNSSIKEEMVRIYRRGARDYFLLGDSGYGLEPWVMTPILNAGPGSAEERYTNWHCQARNTVERANGWLKGSFRCIGHDRALHYAPEKCSSIIYTACVLYNIMRYFRVPYEDPEGADEADDVIVVRPVPQPARTYRAALARRQLIIDTYFQ